MKGKDFQNLAQVLFDAGRSLKNSSIQIQNILLHPNYYRKKNNFLVNSTVVFNCI